MLSGKKMASALVSSLTNRLEIRLRGCQVIFTLRPRDKRSVMLGGICAALFDLFITLLLQICFA